MNKILKYSRIIVFSIILFSCNPKEKETVKSDIFPYIPMRATLENSLEYIGSQKKVYASKLLTDSEAMGAWEHDGKFGTLTLSSEKSYKGKNSVLLESPTRGTGTDPVPRGGRSWGGATAFLKVNDENWTDWNRITFWIYPDMPGHKIINVNLAFNNDGEEKVPWSYAPNGSSRIVIENQKWNKVYWEIAHLGRDKVTGISISYSTSAGAYYASNTARFFIDEVYLEKVDAEHFEGWDVAPGEISYNHAGYVKGYPKVAFTSENIGQKFFLKNSETGATVKEGVISSENLPLGKFQIMDFSDVNTEGTYILEVGKLKTKPFMIDDFLRVFRSSIIKTINHFYTQRCGFAIPGIHEACHLDWTCSHEGKTIPIHGGWHDAGDLSQGLVNTAEGAYSMMMLAAKLAKSDPDLSVRLLEEAEWGVNWVLRTRFDNGFRNVWCTKDAWTDGVIGTVDDFNSVATKNSHANLISATTEAMAAISFKNSNPHLSAHALKCAIEDYKFGLEMEPSRMNIEVIGAALNAALMLYEVTSDEFYKKSAIENANYIISCQQQDATDPTVPLKGYFYRSPEKEVILHYSHRAHELDAVVGLVKLAKLFPSEGAECVKALKLYTDYYKEISTYTAPYYMIPAGIYDITKARDEAEVDQIMNGVRLSERYYIKRFPVWKDYRGNSGTTLTQAKALAVAANFLKDKTLLDIVYHTFEWHLGRNPFSQSLMYGEGYRFPALYSFSSGNLVGGLPVGIQTHFLGDEPYWPTETLWTWKEVWVHPSTRWLMLASDFI